MATKKSNPAVAARKAARQKFVSVKVASKGITKKQANQRFFVQTRMAEMKAKGKTVTPEMRKQLQQKFQSGDVARKGFAAPKKKTGDKSLVTPVKSTVKTPNSSYVDPKKRPVGKTPNSSYMDPKKRPSASNQYAPTYSINQYVRRFEATTPGKKVVVKKK